MNTNLFKNFKSFRKETILDLRATKISDHEEDISEVYGKRVLNIAGIFGPNACGKSNALGALCYMCQCIKNSFKYDDGSKNIIPFNTTIDAQCEFRIVNPNVIYKISDDIVKTENNYTTIESYVDNTVHILISRIIRQNGLSSITNANIQEMMDRELARFNRGHPQGFEKGFDFRISHAILIENIVIVSFDNNISLRQTE